MRNANQSTNLILEELKGMREDMNHNFQALQMLFSEYFRFSTANFQENNSTLEHCDSIQSQTTTNKVSNLHPTEIKSAIAENREGIHTENINMSLFSSLYRDQDPTSKNGSIQETETPKNETVCYYNGSVEEKMIITDDHPQINNLIVEEENKLMLLINGLEHNDGITGISDLQCQETCTSDSTTHADKSTCEEENITINYLCQICNECFSSKSSLTEHVNSCAEKQSIGSTNYEVAGYYGINVKKDKNKCDYCGMCFKYRSGLKCHLTKHTGEKPFQCNFCPKRFAQLGNLNSHVRIHTGEKPYKCKFCPKTFTQSCHLQSHNIKHAGEKF